MRCERLRSSESQQLAPSQRARIRFFPSARVFSFLLPGADHMIEIVLFCQILRRKQMSAFRVTADVPMKAKIRRS